LRRRCNTITGWPGENELALNQAALDQLRELDPDGSAGLFVQIVDTYIADSANLLQQIRSALAEKDLVGLTRSAHTLKSTSASVGATRVSEIAKALETAGKNNTIDVCPLFLTALSAEHTAAERLLRDECAAFQRAHP
jgi:HPt (histidine-containing phosphotransfer) domain-containing protein